MMELKIEHLRKQFKDKTAVDDVSLTLTIRYNKLRKLKRA